jgi:hypothetical protein
MQFNGPTYHLPKSVLGRLYPIGVLVENTLWVWVWSRWRGRRELAHFFLSTGSLHLPPGSPIMFHLKEIHGCGGMVIGLIASFTNPFDACRLLGRVHWCRCEFICFTTYNIFTQL